MNKSVILRKVREKCLKVEMEKSGYKNVPFYENMTDGSRGKYKLPIEQFITTHGEIVIDNKTHFKYLCLKKYNEI